MVDKNTYQDNLQYLVEYAEDDWVPMSTISTTAASHAGQGATFEQRTTALLTIIADLIDRGAVPGDLLAGDPGFRAWPGSKQQLLDRFHSEVQALGRLPAGGEVCWIHIPHEGEGAT